MKHFVLTVFLFFSSVSFAKSCPEFIRVDFGLIAATTSSQMQDLEQTNRIFKKTSQNSVCRYSTNEFLLEILFDMKNKIMTIERMAYDENLGYVLDIKIERQNIRNKSIFLSRPLFDMYEAVTNERDEVLGYTRFTSLNITW